MIAQGVRQLKMVTDWPGGTPCLHTSAVRPRADDWSRDRRAHQDRGVSGRFAGTRVRNLRCSPGRSGRHYHSFEGYFEGRSRALHFFCGRPVRIRPQTSCSRGCVMAAPQELWDALSAQFNVKPLLCTSPLPDGRVVVREVNSPEDYKEFPWP